MELIHEGSHPATAETWDWGEGKNSEQIAVQFKITDGPDAGRTITWFAHFSDKAMKRSLEGLRYCGWQGNDIGTLDGMGTLPVQIVVEHRVKEQGEKVGQVFAEVRWVNKAGGSGVKLEKPMDAGRKRLFAAKMQMHAKLVPALPPAKRMLSMDAREETLTVSRVPGEDDDSF